MTGVASHRRGGRSRRVVVGVVVATAVIVATVMGGARAEYQGTSVSDNVSAQAQVGGLSQRYPSSRYGLDYHVDAGVTSTDIGIGSIPTGVDLDGVPALIAHTVASWVWDLDRIISNAVITLFTFAFSLDLISGARGVLAPVSAAVNNLYSELSAPWLPVMIALLGCWAVIRIGMRDIVGTFGKLAVSIGCVLLSMLLITQPGWTIGGLSHYSNELSNGILGAVNGDDTAGAKTAAADALFETLVYDPWVVLEFGGTVHCVDAAGKPVKPWDRECATTINHKTKYAERWLAAGAANGKQRTLEYEALRDGKAPDAAAIEDADLPSTAFDGYTLSDADKPAVDIQQQAIAGERLAYAIAIFLGSAGAWLLIGGLACAVILSKLVALLLFAMAAVMLLAAVFPGPGHRAYRGWLERLILALTRAIWYSLIIAIVLALARALWTASANLGWEMAFGLQAAFYWAVFFKRKDMYSALTRALPGATGAETRDRTLGDYARDAYYTAKIAQPVTGRAARAAKGAARTAERTAKGAARVSQNTAREGVQAVGGVVGSSAARGHTERVTAAADLNGRALDELEHEHAANARRARDETGRRARVHELEQRRQVARDGAVPEAEGLALSAEEERELEGLRGRLMDRDEYDHLTGSVADVEQRRVDSDGAPFSEAQITARARVIAARDSGRRRRGEHLDYPEMAARAQRYAEHEHPRIFADNNHDDDAPRDMPRRRRQPSPAGPERRDGLDDVWWGDAPGDRRNGDRELPIAPPPPPAPSFWEDNTWDAEPRPRASRARLVDRIPRPGRPRLPRRRPPGEE